MSGFDAFVGVRYPRYGDVYLSALCLAKKSRLSIQDV
jgi:hypothetical protein